MRTSWPILTTIVDGSYSRLREFARTTKAEAEFFRLPREIAGESSANSLDRPQQRYLDLLWGEVGSELNISCGVFL